MKAFSFIRSSLTGGAGQPLASAKPEATLGVPKVPSLLFDLEVYSSRLVYSSRVIEGSSDMAS